MISSGNDINKNNIWYKLGKYNFKKGLKLNHRVKKL